MDRAVLESVKQDILGEIRQLLAGNLRSRLAARQGAAPSEPEGDGGEAPGQEAGTQTATCPNCGGKVPCPVCEEEEGEEEEVSASRPSSALDAYMDRIDSED